LSANWLYNINYFRWQWIPNSFKNSIQNILNNNVGTFLGFIPGNYPSIPGSDATGNNVVLAGASIASFTVNTPGTGIEALCLLQLLVALE
jgi:hypothetical protein